MAFNTRILEALAWATRYGPSRLSKIRYRICAATSLRRGASLEFKGELKRWPILSMVCDKECLVRFHGLCQLHKIGLSELSGQKICPAIRLHCILHHPLVVIR
jgi:hypothetical protein